jgi:hypothetical protein
MQLGRSILLAAAAVVLVSPAALAARPTMADCNKLAARVTDAIKASNGSAGLAKARTEQSTGAYFCGLGSFAKGIEHYNLALELLAPQHAAGTRPSP